MDAERLQEIAFEADYWRAVLADMGALNALIVRAASEQMNVPMYLIGPIVTASDRDGRDLTKASAASRETMRLLEAMQEPIIRVLELANGRAAVLTRDTDAAKESPA